MKEKRNNLKLAGFLTLVCAFLFVMGSSQMIEGATIRLKPKAEVQGTVIHLGEVAEIYDINPHHVQLLQQITLAPAPAGRRPVVINIETVRSRLKAHHVNLLAVEMSGKSQVEVYKQGNIQQANFGFQNSSQRNQELRRQEIAKDRLKKAIQVHLQTQQYRVGLDEIKVLIREQDRQKLLALQPHGYQIVGGQAPWDRLQQLGVLTKDVQGNISQFVVQMQLNPRPSVVTAKYDIPRGNVLQADDLELRPVERASGLENVSYRVDQLVGMEVKQPIRSGSPIRPTQLQAVEAVKRGAMIKVFSQYRGIKVQMFATALKSGAIGDEIEVETLEKNRGRGKRLHVKIVGVNEAERMIVPESTTLSRIGSR